MEFLLEFDNPSKSYFAGQLLTGRVILGLCQGMVTQGVKIKFHGEAKVHWQDQVLLSDWERERRGGFDTHELKNYDSDEKLVDFDINVIGNNFSYVQIKPGRSMYPFQLALPPNLPSSFKEEYGNVSYEIIAIMQPNHVVREPVTITALVDLNRFPEISQPMQWKEEKEFCCLCCASGPLQLIINLPHTGFVPGEPIFTYFEINNQSDRTIEAISVKLHALLTYTAGGRNKCDGKDILSVNRAGVGPKNSDVFEGQLLQIPSIPPTRLGGCGIINLEYFLRFEAHVDGMGSNLKASIPIAIGTIPFNSTISQYCFQNSAYDNTAIGGGNSMQPGGQVIGTNMLPYGHPST